MKYKYGVRLLMQNMYDLVPANPNHNFGEDHGKECVMILFTYVGQGGTHVVH